MKVSIIIPVYNGAKTIVALVNKVFSSLSEIYSLEVVLVNDCSPLDNSAEICKGLANTLKEVKFVDLSRNFGEHNAVMAGLNYCTGDCAVIMDDDFQNPPQEVVKLIKELEKGFDVVFSSYAKKEHNKFRNLGSSFNNFVASTLLNKPRDLYLSSFKVINRFTINEVTKYKGPNPYLDGLILRVTNLYSTVVVQHDERREGGSGYTLKKLVSLWLNMFTNFSILPLRIATILGFLFSIISFIFIVFFTVEKIQNPDLPIGWASIVVSILLLGGVQLFSIGMIGEYLGRLFLDNGGKPQYVVRSFVDKADGE